VNVSLVYHETLLAHQGIFVDEKLVNTSDLNAEILLEDLVKEGGYILVVEGSIGNGPDGTGKVCMYGGHTFKDIFEKSAKGAAAVIALGTCATYGGITVTNSDVREYCDFYGVNQTENNRKKGMLQLLGINKPCINIPGCPIHPDRFFLTVAAILLGKVDLNNIGDYLDADGRMKVFFPPESTIHDNCPRRGYYDRGILDKKLGQGGCLWKVGCKAPFSKSDCALRKWNNGTSVCMQVGGPCLACTEPMFPNGSMPFYEENARSSILFGANIGVISALAIGAAVAAAGVHAIRRMKE
jgi:hydrogenase small subunit